MAECAVTGLDDGAEASCNCDNPEANPLAGVLVGRWSTKLVGSIVELRLSCDKVSPVLAPAVIEGGKEARDETEVMEAGYGPFEEVVLACVIG